MSQVAHEAEVQRQHTRYRIPLRCELRGACFEVQDWSIGGLSLKDPPADLKIGHQESLKLSFPFTDYAIGISVDAEPRYIDGANKRAGLKFVNVTRRQVDVLRFMIDAYLSGEVVEAKDLIEVSARRNEARARAVPGAEAPTTVRGRLSRGMGRAVRFGAAGLGGLVLLGFIGTGLYERLFVVAGAVRHRHDGSFDGARSARRQHRFSRPDRQREARRARRGGRNRWTARAPSWRARAIATCRCGSPRSAIS